jgi:lysophospholipase
MARLRPRFVKESDGAFDGVDGARLHFHAWEPPDPRAAVVIVHGHGEHGGRYAATASRLASYGYSSYALDLRGHGHSDGRRGHAKSFELFLQDVERFSAEVVTFAGQQIPIFLLGQSMGGLIALRFLQEYPHPFRGAVIVAPWLATAMPIPRWKALLAPLLARLLPILPFRSRLDAALLSHDPAVVAAYRDDPLVHDIMTPRLFIEVTGAMAAAFQHGDRIRDTPLLFLLPGDDRVVDTRRSEAFAGSLQGADVTVRVLPGFYHEPLNERDRGVALDAIRDWVDARL